MTPTETETKELHVIAREWATKLENLGLKVNKKYLRYNIVVETAVKYGSLGPVYNHQISVLSVPEVVCSCFKGTLMYSDLSGPEGIVYDWML